MALVHNSAVRSRIQTRLRALTPGSRPRWGKMSVDQMLWHVNEALACAVGEMEIEGAWPRHHMFGKITGREVSRLHAKHLDHHLRQFGV
jgi:hypothetical protein